MRVVIALAVLVVFLSLGGCSRTNQAAQAEPVAWGPLPHPTAETEPYPLAAKTSQEAEPPLPKRVRRSATVFSSEDDVAPGVFTAAEPDAEVKFKAAQAKAAKLGGVHHLAQEDIDGLSYEQLKQLRGY
jgi:hypothetical protein